MTITCIQYLPKSFAALTLNDCLTLYISRLEDNIGGHVNIECTEECTPNTMVAQTMKIMGLEDHLPVDIGQTIIYLTREELFDVFANLRDVAAADGIRAMVLGLIANISDAEEPSHV